MRLFGGDKKVMNRHEAGITLIEVVVSIGVFVVLIGLVGGAFIVMVRNQSDQFQIQRTIRDVNNFFEIFDREVRMGYGHTFNKIDDSTLELVNQNANCVDYRLENNTIIRRVWDPVGGTCLSPTSGTFSDTNVTSTGTRIERLTFNPVVSSDVKEYGEVDSDIDVPYGQQGRVTVFVAACPDDIDITSWESDNRCIQVQTTITSRQHSVFTP